MQSMTGYSRVSHRVGPATVTAELRSTNHRYFELSQRLPDGCSALEAQVTQLVRSHVQRGRVDVTVTVQAPAASSRCVVFDAALAQAYHATLTELKGRFGLKGGVSLDHFLALPRLIEVKDAADPRQGWRPAMTSALEQAVHELVATRTREGRRLVQDLRAQAATIRRHLQAIRVRLPHSLAQQKRRLRERVASLAGVKTATAVQQRIQEALAIVKDVDIHEEMVRLDSHLVHLRQMLAGRKPIGKTVDFIAQEMTRETNTIGAKVNDAGIARFVIEIKEAVEKIREQAQNLE